MVGFTLIELMVVMLIIGILVGIVSAMVFNILRNGKIRRAESEVRTVGIAVEEYIRTFREIPVSTNWYDPAANDDNECCYVPGVAQGGTTNRTGNPALATEFWNRLSGANGLARDFLKIVRTPENSNAGVLLDPWGNPYEFYLDSNYNGTVKLNPYGPPPLPTDRAFSRNVAAFVRSRGPNRIIDDPRQSGGNDDLTYPPLAELLW